METGSVIAGIANAVCAARGTMERGMRMGRRSGLRRLHALAALCVTLAAVAAPIAARAQSPLAVIRNVFVILMENHNWSSIEGSPSAPYINGTLLPMASRAHAYYNPPGVHPSLPNYLWI